MLYVCLCGVARVEYIRIFAFIIIMSRCQHGSVSFIYRSQVVFTAISCIGTELLYIRSSWSSCLCSSMWRGPLEYIGYEFVLISPAVSCMSLSSNFDSFRDGCRWPYNFCFVGCCLQDLFNIARNASLYIYPYFRCLSLGWGEMKEESVRREEWLERDGKWIFFIQNDFSFCLIQQNFMIRVISCEYEMSALWWIWLRNYNDDH